MSLIKIPEEYDGILINLGVRDEFIRELSKRIFYMSNYGQSLDKTVQSEIDRVYQAYCKYKPVNTGFKKFINMSLHWDITVGGCGYWLRISNQQFPNTDEE